MRHNMNNAKYIRRGVIKQVLPLFLVALSVLMSSCKIVASYDVSDKKSEKSTASYSVKDVNIPKAPTSKEEKESLYMPQALLDELPDDDFGEMYFTVITLAGKNLVFPEEASYIAPALYERNKKVEEKYNIKLYEKAIGENEIIEYLSSGELSGSYYADLIDLPYEYMPLLYEKGLIQDFSTKPFFVENRPYFDFEISDMLNSGYDGLYALYSNALYSPDDMYCLLYNKEAQGAKALEESGFSAPAVLCATRTCLWSLPRFAPETILVCLRTERRLCVLTVYAPYRSFRGKCLLVLWHCPWMRVKTLICQSLSCRCSFTLRGLPPTNAPALWQAHSELRAMTLTLRAQRSIIWRTFRTILPPLCLTKSLQGTKQETCRL